MFALYKEVADIVVAIHVQITMGIADNRESKLLYESVRV